MSLLPNGKACTYTCRVIKGQRREVAELPRRKSMCLSVKWRASSDQPSTELSAAMELVRDLHGPTWLLSGRRG